MILKNHNVALARKREDSMQSRAGKRRRWLSRRWRVSVKGNPWINVDGFRVTVYKRGDGWGATVAQGDGDPEHSRRIYPTEEQAKLAAFDYISRVIASHA